MDMLSYRIIRYIDIIRMFEHNKTSSDLDPFALSRRRIPHLVTDTAALVGVLAFALIGGYLVESHADQVSKEDARIAGCATSPHVKK